EGDETIVLTLLPDAAYTNGSSNSASVTIVDDDLPPPPPPPLPVVTIIATDAAASESGDLGTFTIHRTGSNDVALTVNYTVSGTASNGVDYVSLSNRVTIAAGTNEATI